MRLSPERPIQTAVGRFQRAKGSGLRNLTLTAAQHRRQLYDWNRSVTMGSVVEAGRPPAATVE